MPEILKILKKTVGGGTVKMGGGGIIFCHIFCSDGGGVVQKYQRFKITALLEFYKTKNLKQKKMTLYFRKLLLF